MNRSRRTASPVRVSLASGRGSGIDGAWWPRSPSIARELPDLIQALHPALGEIVDIDINWSADTPTPVLSTMAPDTAAKLGGRAQHRLMFLTGHQELTKLLVIPSMTTSALALMVLRQAADRPIPDAALATKEFLAAERILRAARSESAGWAAVRGGQPR